MRIFQKEEPTTEELRKGRRNEKKVDRVLSNMEEEGLIKWHGKASWLEDLKGTDFFLVVLNDIKRIPIPLQVKSSKFYQDQHKEEHPDIPSVRVGHRTPNTIKKKIKEVIEKFEDGEVTHV